jgi:hypothetical protein
MAPPRLAFLAVALVVTTALAAGGAQAQKKKAPSKKPAATAPAEAKAPEPAPVDTKPADATPVPTVADPRTADEEYDLKMRELEDMVGELKEQIFRSKAKLTLLTEQVAGGGTSGAAIVILHRNEMGDSFLLTEAHYFLDGQPLWNEVDETGKKFLDKDEYPVWDGNIVEGSHTLSVNLVYKGNGTGVFSYLSGYKFKLKDSVTFSAAPGKVVTISSVGFEKGSLTTEMTERPSIRFDNESSNDVRAASTKTPAEVKP